ncbi:MAG: copper chaperone PCu(A)C [Ideonella sp.]
MSSFLKISAGLLLSGLLFSPWVAAQVVKAGAVEIGQVQARSTAAGQSMSSAYLDIRNGGGPDKLLSAASPVASAVEMHTMSMDGNVMRMRQIDAIELPAGQSVELKPGGLHLMLMGLKQPLAVGSHFEMTLVFEKAGPVKVQVDVAAPGGAMHKH